MLSVKNYSFLCGFRLIGNYMACWYNYSCQTFSKGSLPLPISCGKRKRVTGPKLPSGFAPKAGLKIMVSWSSTQYLQSLLLIDSHTSFSLMVLLSKTKWLHLKYIFRKLFNPLSSTQCKISNQLWYFQGSKMKSKFNKVFTISRKDTDFRIHSKI